MSSVEGALRILLAPDRAAPGAFPQPDDPAWEAWVRLARKNVVLIRVADRLDGLGVPAPLVARAAADERERIRRTVALIERIGQLCLRAGTPYVFIKAFQHYPDMGHDVDLFVLDRDRTVDALIGMELGAAPGARSLFNTIAGKASFTFAGVPSPLEVHHGHIGRMGEHTRYPEFLMARRQIATVAGVSTSAPSPEDQLILQAIQRIFDHLSIRVSDVLHSMRLLQGALDWDYIASTVQVMGVSRGLSCYLSYLVQIAEPLMGRTLLPVEAQRRWRGWRWDGLRSDREVYTFPILSVLSRVYGGKLLADIIGRNWEAVGRLVLLPPVSLLSALRWRRRRGARK